jgi:hypothetical protein
MTEAEWLRATDPQTMLRFLQGEAGDRKLRLFAVACCRRTWNLLNTDQNRMAVEGAERCADGLTSQQELAFARDATGHWRLGVRSERHRQAVLARTATDIATYVAGHHPWNSAADVARTAAWMVSHAATKVGLIDSADGYQNWLHKPEASKAAEWIAQASLLRDIFNPFRPSPPLPPAVLAWGDRTVLRIAQAIYDDRRIPEGTLDTSRLAILADALLDAGCDDERLLAHLRSSGLHVRGCWALDCILGKG